MLSPFQIGDSEINEVDLVQPAIASEGNTSRDERRFSLTDTDTKSEITEAQGWIINQRGNLELVAQKIHINHSNIVETNNFSNICS